MMALAIKSVQFVHRLHNMFTQRVKMTSMKGWNKYC